MNMIWKYMREEEFQKAIEISKSVCVIPMGCLEKHGVHLPVGTDILEASYILKKASELEPVCIFPDFVFGDVQGHYNAKGGIVLSVETELQLLKEICSEIARNGFKKILIYNGHGGNQPLIMHFLRSQSYSKKDYVVMYYMMPLVAPYQLMDMVNKGGREQFPELTDEDIEVMRDFVMHKKTMGHGCFGETAYILGSYPETVRMDRLGVESGLSTKATQYLNDAGIHLQDDGWIINYLNRYSGHDPYGCNERIGKAAIRVAAEDLAKRLKIIKEDDNILKWNEEFNKSW